MTPSSHAKSRAAEAQAALAVRGQAEDANLATSIQDLVCDLGHLADENKLDFIAILTRALRHWQVERVDPASMAPGPVVEIYIGTEGLPPKPKPIKRPDKRKKSRPA